MPTEPERSARAKSLRLISLKQSDAAIAVVEPARSASILVNTRLLSSSAAEKQVSAGRMPGRAGAGYAAMLVQDMPSRSREVMTPHSPNYHSSFDCTVSHGSITSAICNDRELAALDLQLAKQFAVLDRSLNVQTNRMIHHDQTVFLNNRQGCGDLDCLSAMYRKRIKELGNVSG